MIEIGRYHRLRVNRQTDHGAYLTDGSDEVLLPRRYVPDGIQPGDEVRVFVATDSEDRPVATTRRPAGVVGEFVTLLANDVTPVGAFMEWGLDKDLLVPFAEQQRPIEPGGRYVVRIGLDARTNRLYGSTKIARYVQGNPADLAPGQKVALLVVEPGMDGTRVIVDGRYLGMIFPDEMHDRLKVGEERSGYVKRIREDGGIAISLSPGGFSGAQEVRPLILEKLRRAGGFLPLTDRSSPEEIRRNLGISKGTFKKAAGMLYKSGEIDISYHGMRLVEK